MKIQVMPQDMVQEIGTCQRAISNRTTMHILECIRFQAKGSGVILTATDLELSIETRISCQVMEEGTVVIPANMIGNIFRKLPNEPAIVEEKGGIVTIDCGQVHFEIQVPNASEFPALPDVEEESKTIVDNDALIQAVRETEFATSLDESKIALTGIFFERKNDRIRLVTLDGYRMAVREILLPPEAEAFEKSAIVPKRAFNELARIIREGGATTMALSTGYIYFSSGSIKMYSRLIDKNYIQYEEIISREFKSKVILSRHAFQGALERATILAKEERANLIKLLFEEGNLNIQSNSEIGSVHEKVACQLEGGEITIAFNAKYLLDGIKALNCEEVSLYLNGPLNPMVIHPAQDEDSYLYLVLPVRIASE